MITTILHYTPTWVWGLLAGLIALGTSMAFTREITLRRATIMPLAMVGLSLYGVASVFSPQPMALAAWAVGLAVTASITIGMGIGRGATWMPETRLLRVPGSWWPLAIILGIFFTKFAVGVTLALHPDFARDSAFATSVGLVYGAFSGVFLGRGAALWKAAQAGIARTTSLA
jgi:hypothetical protein